MIDTPKVVEGSARQIAYIHLTVPRDEIQFVMGPGITEIVETITAQGIAITGPWFTHHLRRPTDSFDFNICFPVATPVKETGRVKSAIIPAAQTIQTVYQGPYEGLGDAWGEFIKWIDNSNHETGEDLFECYVQGPQTSDDSSTWRTELSRQLVTK